MLIHTVLAGRFFETGDAGAMGRAMPMLFVPEEGLGPVNFNLPYVAGMTRLGGPRISGAKFFVTVAAQPSLNGRSPCFGQVVDGRETVFNISQVKSYSNQRPIQDVRIERIRIFPVGEPPPLPAPEPYQPRRKEVELRPDRAPAVR
jgi:cyclophilin family peptidyl-prolyl cis-trans isomerase